METLKDKALERSIYNGFAKYNQIELEHIEPDKAVFKINIRQENKNPYGMLHGGAIYTMADQATGTAAHTDGRSYVTQTSAMHFLRNQAEGVVYATGTVRHRGRSTVLTAVAITGEDGKLIATGEFTFFCVDKAVMDAKIKK